MEGRLPQAEPPIPVLTDADRAAAFPDVPGHGVHDKKINSFILLDKFEYQDADNGSALAWDAKGGSAVTSTAPGCVRKANVQMA